MWLEGEVGGGYLAIFHYHSLKLLLEFAVLLLDLGLRVTVSWTLHR